MKIIFEFEKEQEGEDLKWVQSKIARAMKADMVYGILSNIQEASRRYRKYGVTAKKTFAEIDELIGIIDFEGDGWA